MNDEPEKERYLVRGKQLGDHVACKIIAKHLLKGGGTTIETYPWMIPMENVHRHDKVINLEDMPAYEVESILHGGYTTGLSEKERVAINAISAEDAPL